MAVNFQAIQQQIRDLGENALSWERQARASQKQALALIGEYATQGAALRQKVSRTATQFDPNLRCALPVSEGLDTRIPPVALPDSGTIIAADGSQINPDRHLGIDYSFINVGAVQMELGALQTPRPHTQSQLFYGKNLLSDTGQMTERDVALTRDLRERKIILDLAKTVSTPPVITFTDGPLELWGAFETHSTSNFRKSLEEYLQILHKLHRQGITTAGYVDKPGANLVTRMLEVALTPEDELQGIRRNSPLIGANDINLFADILPAGHRSAIFGLQTRTASDYQDALSLHFFYLNVGREGKPYLARVEIPAWVAEDQAKIKSLHAVLLDQCQILASRPYPYLLHRAHEAAVVTLTEKDQITRMIVHELRRRGITVASPSSKQAAKALHGRTRYAPA